LFPSDKPDGLGDRTSFGSAHLSPSLGEPDVPLASSQQALEHERQLPSLVLVTTSGDAPLEGPRLVALLHVDLKNDST